VPLVTFSRFMIVPRRKVLSHSTSLASQESPAFELLPETCPFR
jgi:hypothetical protein